MDDCEINIFRLVLFIEVFASLVVCDDGEGEGDNSSVNTGAIAAACVVGVIIIIIATAVCFHECCSKPKRKVQPQRISVLSVNQHRVPPSRVIPNSQSKTGISSVDPPPYTPHDHQPYMLTEPRAGNPFSRHAVPTSLYLTESSSFNGHPPPLIPFEASTLNRPSTLSKPPQYSE